MESYFNKIGHIRTRDKRLEGEESQIDRQRRKHKPTGHTESNALFKGRYRTELADRIECERQRIEAEEKLMREVGIDPHRAGSAARFDKLVN